jgi:magnesium-transporting ATPase (P-type)
MRHGFRFDAAARADLNAAAQESLMPDSALKTKFWQTGLADLERQLGTGRDGLGSAEAAARQLRYGPNTLEERRRVSLPLRFLSRFRNPLVLILLAAAAISALTGDLSSFIIIGGDRADERDAGHRAGIPGRGGGRAAEDFRRAQGAGRA